MTATQADTPLAPKSIFHAGQYGDRVDHINWKRDKYVSRAGRYTEFARLVFGAGQRGERIEYIKSF